MISYPLPRTGWCPARLHTGIFTDHTLFTGTVEDVYDYPEHTAGLGILTMFAGAGECALNHRTERLSGQAWMLVNKGSRLSLHLSQMGTRPVILFFHTRMVERLLGSGDFAPLERMHTGELTFRPQLEELAALGDSCSSFITLKADSIIRNILDALICHARQAAMLASRLEVAKGSTRIELFKRLSAARDHILTHYASSVTLDDMAEIAMLNRQHFLRMFRQCYRLTPHQFLTEIRLQQAQHRLLHSEDSVTLICLQTGFESLSSFSGLFRQRFGLSPSALRRSRQVMN
ncbi:MAG: helix-turn-helix transcriptional regulator [Chitinophagaceae bacterium]|nr:helix-turn-helix transcriptional regulator [Chitinophagaceae bacterium]